LTSQPPFKRRIGRTVDESSSDFPKEVQAPVGAPNILLILTDDVGYGATTTFGEPIPTPTMDRLAQSGLRYTEFHFRPRILCQRVMGLRPWRFYPSFIESFVV
jgi:hypothetical protein